MTRILILREHDVAVEDVVDVHARLELARPDSEHPSNSMSSWFQRSSHWLPGLSSRTVTACVRPPGNRPPERTSSSPAIDPARRSRSGTGVADRRRPDHQAERERVAAGELEPVPVRNAELRLVAVGVRIDVIQIGESCLAARIDTTWTDFPADHPPNTLPPLGSRALNVTSKPLKEAAPSNDRPWCRADRPAPAWPVEVVDGDQLAVPADWALETTV